MFTVSQLVAHGFGDYVLQSHWMATEKTKKSVAALAHVIMYGLCFLPLRPSWAALFVIVSTHFVIDRWRLARYVCWLKNWIGLPVYHTWEEQGCPVWAINLRWTDCHLTGYPRSIPPFLAVWLLIIVDNLMHVTINGLALHCL